MILKLEKFDYEPGDTIKGSMDLSLKKPIKARKLEVALLGKVKTTRRDSNGNISTHDETIYNFAIPLDGEKEYQNGQYPFEIKIQPDILRSGLPGQQLQQEMEKKLGTIGSVLGQMVTGQRSVHWMIHAHLDIPWKLDVQKSQDIVISQEYISYSNNI